MTETQTAPILVDLTFERSTKGTHVYSAADPAAAIPTLYIKKSAFAGTAPKMIRLIVEDIAAPSAGA